MLYVCEFEFVGEGGVVTAAPLGGLEGGTFGDDFEDAVLSAADWLTCMVDGSLMEGIELPPMSLGHEPERGGRVIAIAVSRELSDIPAMTAADAARRLGVSRARIAQLCKSGKLDSWQDGTRRMVSRASVEARIEHADYERDTEAVTA